MIPWYGANVKVMQRHFRACIDSSVKPNQIIICNDGYKDDRELVRLIETMSNEIPFLYIKILEDIPWNMPECLNLAIWFSTEDALSLEDCDVIPEYRYYQTGLCYIPDYGKFSAHYTNVDGHPAACGIYSRKALTEVGGFEEDFAGYYGFNDIYLSAKLDTSGFMTFISRDKLLTVDMDGESKDADRDNSRNRELMTELLKTFPVNLNLFRHPYKIKRFVKT